MVIEGGWPDAARVFEASHALAPLVLTSLWEAGEAPETLPSGF